MQKYHNKLDTVRNGKVIFPAGKFYLVSEVDEKIATLTEQLRKEGEEMLFWRHQHRDAEKKIATLEREKAEIFIAAPMSENQAEINRDQMLEHIAALKIERDSYKEQVFNQPALEREIVTLKDNVERAEVQLRKVIKLLDSARG